MQSSPPSKVLLDIYRRMSLIKANDTRIIATMKAGRLTMPYYSARGQECIPAVQSHQGHLIAPWGCCETLTYRTPAL